MYILIATSIIKTAITITKSFYEQNDVFKVTSKVFKQDKNEAELC